ncbi:hypothetical protein BU15DRAFT_83245 [Melanogaster broomeanus]|nr:hypothetical protein BU15DRAFT_83245 [Melanogaster broomeanus]
MTDQFQQLCVCGRAFSRISDFTKHERGCIKGKKRLSGALSRAKEAYQRKKLHRDEAQTQTEGDNVPQPEHDVSKTWTRSADDHSDNAPNPEPALSTSRTLAPETCTLPGGASDTLSLAQRRPRRLNRRLPLRFRDMLPEGALPLPPPGMELSESPPQGSSDSYIPCPPSPSLSAMRPIFKTQQNKFGLFRVFKGEGLPSHDPDEHPTGPLSQLTSAANSAHPIPPMNTTSSSNPFHPYPNESSLRLGDWYWNHGSQKSQESFKKLLGIIGDLEFNPEDIRNTNWKAIDRELGSSSDDVPEAGDGWSRSPVTISVPFHRRSSNPGPCDYTVPDFHHRRLVSIIRETLSDPFHHHVYHHEPYELWWHPPNRTCNVRVHGELYTSEAFIKAQDQLLALPHEPNCDLPRCIAALMFWSDATQLTSFGSAKLWPLYLYFGNQSKYRRCQPSSKLCSHVAYFQSLPDAFKDFVTERSGGKPSDALLTHCHRELFHAQWRILLDDEFLEAYEHGIVITCQDEVRRRIYPRIFTYSADYPEKVLIATIRNLGKCPCPRCLIPKARVDLLATEADVLQRRSLSRSDTAQRRAKVVSARKLIYESNYANAFSEKLSHTGFDLFMMLAIDLLHELELGVWKAIFIHLLRILQSVKHSEISELDKRYRQVPTFGQDTIRRFRENCSELKKMTAQGFEDLLQCALPVFENLLPKPHNSQVQRLLFYLCHWHALAKLRMHTDYTLDIMERLTVQLAQEMRKFAAETCPAFVTKELRREAESRRRREAQGGPAKTAGEPAADVCRQKTLNLQTYKLHALGDYHNQIRMFGTTDSFSTQPGELEHRVGKGRFTRTSRKAYIPQLASMERRQERIRRIKARATALHAYHQDPAPNRPDIHHVIGQSQNFPENILTFQARNSDDPAVKNFIPKLKAHLLPRARLLHCNTQEGPLTHNEDHILDADLSQVILKGERIYRHNLFRINYTTYDVRRAQDTVNPRTDHRDIILLSRDPSIHPFCYARVLGIYHANVIYIGPGHKDYRPRRIEFLWVRWFEVLDRPAGWEHAVLDSVKFPPMAEVDAFGFVDPTNVLRCWHIIPAFADGQVHPDGVALSRNAQDATDWKRYYVNRFVDRDMVMRYHWGLGVGHTYTHGNSELFNSLIPTSISQADSGEGLSGSNSIANPICMDQDSNSDLDWVDSDFEVEDTDDEQHSDLEELDEEMELEQVAMEDDTDDGFDSNAFGDFKF